MSNSPQWKAASWNSGDTSWTARTGFSAGSEDTDEYVASRNATCARRENASAGARAFRAHETARAARAHKTRGAHADLDDHVHGRHELGVVDEALKMDRGKPSVDDERDANVVRDGHRRRRRGSMRGAR